MIKYQDVTGKEIFSVEEGKAWGRISEVLFNSKKCIVTGFIIKDKTSKFLDIADVTTFGEASIVFASGKLLSSVEDAQKKKNVVFGNILPGLKAITKKGSDAGKVDSFYFREEDGKITHYELSQGTFSGKGLLSSDGVVFIGPDAIIVDDSAVKVAMQMKTKDNFSIAFSKIAKKTKRFSKETVEKLKGAKDGAEKQMIELKKNTDKGTNRVKEKTKVLSGKAGEEFDKIKSGTKIKAKKVKEKKKEISKKPKQKPKVKDAINKTKKKTDK